MQTQLRFNLCLIALTTALISTALNAQETGTTAPAAEPLATVPIDCVEVEKM